MALKIVILALLLALPAFADKPDQDGDGIADATDNCVEVENPGQEDSDNDLCGNQCDADYNQDSKVNTEDFLLFQACFSGLLLPVCDHNSDGVVSIIDFGIFRQQYDRGEPGLGLSPKCNGRRSWWR